MSILRRESSKSPWFSSPFDFVRHIGEAEHLMLCEDEKRLCATFSNILVLGTGHNKATYNVMLSECNPIIFHI